jgi:signal transduction histidine kinase
MDNQDTHVMDDKLRKHATIIIENAQLLLSARLGALTSYQEEFLRHILANAEKFIHLYAAFHDATAVEISLSMRHDLGNPLTPIRGYTDLLQRPMAGTLNPRQQVSIQQIAYSSEALRLGILEAVHTAKQATAGTRPN